MAQEALSKVMEAEAEVDRLIRAASEEARSAIASANDAARERRRELSARNEDERRAIIKAAEDEALASSEHIVAEGASQVELIENPDPGRLDAAVRVIVERIVGA